MSGRYTNTSERAVDGNLDINSCAGTGSITQPWWSVDLGRQTIVTHVFVTFCGENWTECIQHTYIAKTHSVRP